MYHTCTSTDALNSEGHFWLLFWPTLFGFWSTNFLWHFILESVLSHPVSILLLKKITDSPNYLVHTKHVQHTFSRRKTCIFSYCIFIFGLNKKKDLLIFITHTVKAFSSLILYSLSLIPFLSASSKFKCKFYLWILIWL